MKFYCPKVKKAINETDWDYEYLFDWSGLDIEPFNNTVCADMQLNECTLRELLTALMLQVGCIPTCDYLKLGFIDFRIEQTEFVRDNTISGMVRSNSSDSNVNSLIISPTQVLDSTNEIITENIGFRDSSNVLIKQLENLKLETRFPIYNIKNVKMRYGISNNKFRFAPKNLYNVVTDGFYPIEMSGGLGEINGGAMTLYKFSEYFGGVIINFVYNTSKVHKGTIKNIKVHFCKYENNKFTELRSFETGTTTGWHLTLDDNTQNVILDNYIYRAKAMNFDDEGTFGPSESSGVHYIESTFNYYIDIPLGIHGPTMYDEATHVWIENDWIDDLNGAIYHQILPLSYIQTTGVTNTKRIIPCIETHSSNNYCEIAIYEGQVFT